jgi:hypothetical protein
LAGSSKEFSHIFVHNKNEQNTQRKKQKQI